MGGTLKCQADGMGFAIKQTSYTRYRIVSFSFCSFVGSFSLQGSDFFFKKLPRFDIGARLYFLSLIILM